MFSVQGLFGYFCASSLATLFFPAFIVDSWKVDTVIDLKAAPTIYYG